SVWTSAGSRGGFFNSPLTSGTVLLGRGSGSNDRASHSQPLPCLWRLEDMRKLATYLFAVGAATQFGSAAQAADHGDPPGLTGTAPAITADQDIADLYAWRPNATDLAVAVTFSRNVPTGSTFDSAFIYRVLINRNGGGGGGGGGSGQDTDI